MTCHPGPDFSRNEVHHISNCEEQIVFGQLKHARPDANCQHEQKEIERREDTNCSPRVKQLQRDCSRPPLLVQKQSCNEVTGNNEENLDSQCRMVSCEGRDPRRKTSRPPRVTQYDEKYRDSTQPIERRDIPGTFRSRCFIHSM